MAAIQVFLNNNIAVYLFTSALLGLIVGSFLNVVIYRLPFILEREWKWQCKELLGQSDPADNNSAQPFNLVVPRSRCPHCGHQITALENIPVLSFLWLRGKCRACQRSISVRYPFVEALTAVLTLAVAWRFGVSVTALAAMLLTWALLALAFIDLDHQLLPDIITLPFLWAGLLVNLIYNSFAMLQAAVIGAVAGYLFLWLVFHLFKLITGKEGMGYGDFKLFALFGAWLGWQMLPLIIMLASAAGALVGISNMVFRGAPRNQPIPFGPFLCAAGWVALLWGPEINRYYFQLAHISN